MRNPFKEDTTDILSSKINSLSQILGVPHIY
jgi:hypothetical protein